MKKLTVLLFFIFMTTMQVAGFETQKDSYFSGGRTMIDWSLGCGLGSGSATGFLGMNNGTSGELEMFRLVGRIRPAGRFLEYVWLKWGISYDLYEDSNNIYEMMSEEISLGVGFNLAEKGFLKNITPYIGGGVGYGMIVHKRDILSSPSSSMSDGILYMQSAGIECKVFDMVTLFIEEQFKWGSVLDDAARENYIPSKYDNYSGNVLTVQPGQNFDRKEIERNQLTIRAGLRFYWLD